MDHLKDEIRKLPKIEGTTVWKDVRQNLRNTMLQQDDWWGFRSWSTVHFALYSDPKSCEPEKKYLENTRWKSILLTADPGTCTSVTQMYNLALYEEVTGKQLSDGDKILEFGGGYGEMGNIVQRMIDPKWYYIYDFPELCILQKWYWKEVCGMEYIPRTTSDIEQIVGLEPDLFVSICGISEAPMPFKRHFLDIINPNGILIQYQGAFEGHNNVNEFTDYAESRFNNVHHTLRMGGVRHCILIAWDPK